MVRLASGRNDQVRREPAEEVRGHRQRPLLRRGALPSLWHRAARHRAVLGRARACKIFRVDNPHTKPIPFWQWLIREVNDRHPDVIFLAEAFTRPKMMKKLAKIGFQQSYTYFTWRNTKQELIEYVTELHGRDGRVLPAELLRQHAGHQPVLSPDQRSGRLHRARHARRDAVERLGPLQRLRDLRGHADARQGGISRLGEIRAQGLGLRPARQHQGAHPQAQPHPARRTRRSGTSATSLFLNAWNDQILVLCAA